MIVEGKSVSIPCSRPSGDSFRIVICVVVAGKVGAGHHHAVDAGKEAQRLREAAAAGEDTDKIKTPVIKRRKRGLLEGIF